MCIWAIVFVVKLDSFNGTCYRIAFTPSCENLSARDVRELLTVNLRGSLVTHTSVFSLGSLQVLCLSLYDVGSWSGYGSKTSLWVRVATSRTPYRDFGLRVFESGISF